MVFNSPLFLGLYLPGVLLGYGLLSRWVSRRRAWGWLLGASFVFYAWSRPSYLTVLLGSAGFNYWAGQSLTRQPGTRRGLFLLAVCLDVLLLGFFKYGPSCWEPARSLAWPLGLSFYTFSQLAYLVDAYLGAAPAYAFTDYLLFVTFFPYVTAGPIASHGEVIPQLQEAKAREAFALRLSVGLTFLVMGLFKKTVLADGIGAYVVPIFDAASAGKPVTLIESWLGAVSFMLYLYFDFSGYSDMAIGIARFFGIQIPFNFNSPYKAVNIIDFWSRWHMTLTRFLTNYIYNPMVLSVARRRAQQGPVPGGKRSRTLGGYAWTVAMPSCVTMAIAGVWHGVGWNFLIFGLLHGVYLSVNHAWHWIKPSSLKEACGPVWIRTGVARVLTLSAVLVSFVFFHADSPQAALNVLKGMAGWHGVALPVSYQSHLLPWLKYLPLTIEFPLRLLVSVMTNTLWVVALLALVGVAPNTQQWVGSYAKDGLTPETAGGFWPPQRWRWRPTILYAVATGLAATLALWFMLSVNRPMEFIYFQF